MGRREAIRMDARPGPFFNMHMGRAADSKMPGTLREQRELGQ
jgi:hypothetical protein